VPLQATRECYHSRYEARRARVGIAPAGHRTGAYTAGGGRRAPHEGRHRLRRLHLAEDHGHFRHRTMRQAPSEVKSAQSLAPDARLVYNKPLEAGIPEAVGQLALLRRSHPVMIFAGPFGIAADE